MKVTAELNNLRVAPRKVRLVAKLMKGMDVKEALLQLDVTVKKSSEYMHKLLASAVANGENNFGLSKDNLYVFDVVVGEGQTMKRWMPKAYGRAGRILKRTSKVRIVLEERVEGLNRKSKEELEKERAERAKARSKQQKEEIAAREEQQKQAGVKKEKVVAEKSAKIDDKAKKGGEKAGLMNKIFRRKSM